MPSKRHTDFYQAQMAREDYVFFCCRLTSGEMYFVLTTTLHSDAILIN